jgi:hypothetical protein
MLALQHLFETFSYGECLATYKEKSFPTVLKISFATMDKI